MSHGGPGVGPGWYADPWGIGPNRWWDGNAWTGWVQPTPPQPPSDPPPTRGLQGWARAAVVVYPLVQLVGLVVVLANLVGLRNAVHQFEDQLDYQVPGQVATLHLPSAYTLTTVLQLPVLALVVVWLIWQHRAASASRNRGYPAKWSPGFGIGCWFIPVVNLWMPYQALRDILPPRHPSRPMAAPAWAGYLVGIAGSGVAVPIGYFSTGAGVAAGLVAATGWVVLAYFGWRLVGAVGSDQGGWHVSQA